MGTGQSCFIYWEELFQQILYIFVGSFSVMVNLSVIIAIIKTQRLHKKIFVLLSGLSVGHVFNGTHYLTSGCVRIQKVLACNQNFNVTRFYCMQNSSTSIIVIGESICACMMLFLSLDRMIATGSIPKCMNKLKDMQFAYVALSISAIVALIDCSVAWLASYLSMTDIVLSMCIQAYAIPNWYYTMHKIHVITAGYLSVFIYVWVMCSLSHRRRNQVTNDSIKIAQMKREWKVTKRLAFIILMTLAFQIIPVTFYISNLKSSSFLTNYGAYVWTVYCANDAWDIIFYAWKMKDLRKAMCEMFCCCVRSIDNTGGKTIANMNNIAVMAAPNTVSTARQRRYDANAPTMVI